MPESTERTALYRLYDADGQLLYVGISSNPDARWRQHASEKGWWSDVTTKSVEWFETRKSAHRVEVAEIEDDEPLHNCTGEKCERRQQARRMAKAREDAVRNPGRTRGFDIWAALG